jgi:hypothetical protein
MIIANPAMIISQKTPHTKALFYHKIAALKLKQKAPNEKNR